MSRPLIVGPDSGPPPPFPIRLRGRIITGFGRGSRELGIPTANIPTSGAKVGGKEVESGVYYGWAGLDLSTSTTSPAAGVAPADNGDNTSNTTGFTVYPMVVSIGFNPFYQNTVRSVEVHIMKDFGRDFYGAKMNLAILGFIRNERGYDSMDELVNDIRFDIEVGNRSLEREAYERYKTDEYLLSWGEEGEHAA